MNRLTDHEKTWGPFTVAPWKNQISLSLRGTDEYDGPFGNLYFLIVLFGYALRIELPFTVAGSHDGHVEYGFTISQVDGKGFDYIHIRYGLQTWDSATTKSWFKSFPWKQWRCVRNSLYTPDHSPFFCEDMTDGNKGFFGFLRMKEKCPASYFAFEDYDGQPLIATCIIEEREWHRGEGWFKWLKYFYCPMIRRSLDLSFNGETGPEKGSWKGGTIGTGTSMAVNETPAEAFRRYCEKEHIQKGRKYKLKFVGPCDPPPPKPAPPTDAEEGVTNAEGKE